MSIRTLSHTANGTESIVIINTTNRISVVITDDLVCHPIYDESLANNAARLFAQRVVNSSEKIEGVDINPYIAISYLFGAQPQLTAKLYKKYNCEEILRIFLNGSAHVRQNFICHPHHSHYGLTSSSVLLLGLGLETVGTIK